VSLPQATVEAIIALTIIYLALEVSESKKYKSTPWLIAFGFGLLHGLGFANALTGIGIGMSSCYFLCCSLTWGLKQVSLC
jgi:uncharacterized membrane protein YfcA